MLIKIATVYWWGAVAVIFMNMGAHPWGDNHSTICYNWLGRAHMSIVKIVRGLDKEFSHLGH